MLACGKGRHTSCNHNRHARQGQRKMHTQKSGVCTCIARTVGAGVSAGASARAFSEPILLKVREGCDVREKEDSSLHKSSTSQTVTPSCSLSFPTAFPLTRQRRLPKSG